ncbi:MAG: hypothetical protein AAF916_04460 [Planctomycetota bacterium]
MKSRIARIAFGFALVALGLAGPTPVHASLTIYYDPGTGNVAFDTASTATGLLTTYQMFDLDWLDQSGVGFLGENHVRISDAVAYSAENWWISDRTRPGEVLDGYYSIGNVFPVGLTEDELRNDFLQGVSYYHADIETEFYGIRGFESSEPYDVVYGQPDREYDNYWETIDLSTLDWAETAVIGYDAWTGELWLDTTGPDSGYLSTLHLVATEPVFDPDAFVSPFETPLTLATTTSIAAAAGYPVEPGVYSLGRIMPRGLSAEALAGMFETARFLGQAGVEGSGFDFEGNAVAAQLKHYRSLPEPAAAFGLVFTSAALLRRRARHA